MVVWILTGLWHGASWNFVIWGLYFGVILLVEKLFLSKVLEKLPNFLKRAYLLIIVIISFIIFNGEGVNQILTNISGLIGIGEVPLTSLESLYYLKSYLLILIIGIIGATPIMKKIAESKKIHKLINVLEPIFLILILLISTSYIVDGSFNPFLYFRF